MDNYKDFKDILPDYVNEENFDLYKMRHSAEHVLHQAMSELYPKVKRAMGPATKDGFYYDFDPNEVKISEEDFEKIESKMHEIVNRKLPITRHDISVADARKLFKDNPYKQEWLDEYEKDGKDLTVYWTGEPNQSGSDVDLCKGPHVDNTKNIGYYKLLSIAGAYWRGDEKNKMLTRIYATSYKSKKELDEYIWQLEEAKKRDHRKIGKEQDLFTFSDLVGPGLPMWTPKGAILREQLDNYVWELRKAKGYQKVAIPHITKKSLYETSGHWDKYSEDLFRIQTRDGEEMAIKPMNCPHHTQIFAHIPRSYREMPQRYAETTMVYRAEQSGELSGLSRVLCITQDDAHVFLRKNQIREEIEKIWDIVDNLYSKFDMPLRVRLSFRDQKDRSKYLGDNSVWEEAENQMTTIAKSRNADYFIGYGEASFYAPKLDFMAKDSIGREHQVATIQLDLNMPVRFGLTCINESGEKEQIFMIHAAIMGSIERFLSVLIEHLAGAYPAWLAPVQGVVIPISEEQSEYAEEIKNKLEEEGMRFEADLRSETMQSKIRDAQGQKIPYMLIVGNRERESESVSVRYRNEKANVVFKVEDFIAKLKNRVAERKLEIEL